MISTAPTGGASSPPGPSLGPAGVSTATGGAPPQRAPLGRRPSLAERARASAQTTPGRIRLLVLLVVVSLIVAWVVDTGVVSHRRHGLATVSQSEALVVLAQRIQTELDDADAGEANAFLAGGIELADQRNRYAAGVSMAATDLTEAARQGGTTGAAGDAIRTIAQELPVYTGLIESARAGNRQNFPVGAAYLRAASRLMHDTIEPAATTLARLNAQRLNDGEHSATAASDVVLVVASTALALAALGVLQVFLARRTRRALNAGLALATLVSVALAAVVLVELSSEQRSVLGADGRSYTAVAKLARSRALAFQAKGDESQALIARGNGQEYLADFHTIIAQVGGASDGGLIAGAQAAATTREATDALGSAVPALATYLRVHGLIESCDAGGQHDVAVALGLSKGPPPSPPTASVIGPSVACAGPPPVSVPVAAFGSPPVASSAGTGGASASSPSTGAAVAGSSTGSSSPTSSASTASSNGSFRQFDDLVSRALSAEQARFDAGLASARHRLALLPVVIGLALLGAALLALGGPQPRINEYR